MSGVAPDPRSSQLIASEQNVAVAGGLAPGPGGRAAGGAPSSLRISRVPNKWPITAKRQADTLPSNEQVKPPPGPRLVGFQRGSERSTVGSAQRASLLPLFGPVCLMPTRPSCRGAVGQGTPSEHWLHFPGTERRLPHPDRRPWARRPGIQALGSMLGSTMRRKGSNGKPEAPMCPCCSNKLTPAQDVPHVRDMAEPGDLYCQPCQWFFASEMTPGTWEGPRTCPTHGKLEGRRAPGGSPDA
jgi:hypothetical protein